MIYFYRENCRGGLYGNFILIKKYLQEKNGIFTWWGRGEKK
jgi:hypothetical protein